MDWDWDGYGWSPVGVKYRAAYAANKLWSNKVWAQYILKLDRSIYKNDTEVIWQFSKNYMVQGGYMTVSGSYMTVSGGYRHGYRHRGASRDAFRHLCIKTKGLK